MKSFGSTFYGIDTLGTLFEFTRLDLLQVKVEVAQVPEASPEILDELNAFDEVKSIDQKEQVNQAKSKLQSKKEIKPVDRLITCLPQTEVSTACEMRGAARFLLYNDIGCLVEYDTGVKTVEVDYHDISVFCRKRKIFTGREVRSVALSGMSIAYCTNTDMGFVGEVDWEFETEEIVEVAFGSGWVAGLSDEDVYIFDFAGNCTNRIGIDRTNVAMRGYEDMLVLVYHDAVPFDGSQSLRMRIYNITGNSVKVKEEIAVPISRSSTLKAFGISSKGLIYSQDSLDKIRVFQFTRPEWTLIIDPTASE
jgi:hypothetical protein